MSNLVLIESVIKNMDAKETRSVIMLANDRLEALGETVVQPSKNQPSGKSHGGYKRRPQLDYNSKVLPLALGDFCDAVSPTTVHKTFRDLDLEWCNLEPKPTHDDGRVVILTVGKKFAKKMYVWGTIKKGLANVNINGVEIPNFYNRCGSTVKDVNWCYDLSKMSTSGFNDLQNCIDDMRRYRDMP